MSVYAQPKTLPDRDPAYRTWLRDWPCVVCGANPKSEVHHLDSSGTGTKGSDYEAIPACRKCHDLLGTKQHEVLRTRYAFDWVDAWRASGKYYREWIKERLGGYHIGVNGETLVYDGPESGGQ